MRKDYEIKNYGPLEVVTLAAGDNYIYLLAVGAEAAVIDPGHAGPVLRYVREKKLGLTKIINTHGHFDHTAGNQEIKRTTGALVYGPRKCEIPAMDHALDDGHQLKVGSVVLNTIYTPGHTAGDVCFYTQSVKQGIAWTGDTLFVGGCGRLFTRDAETMWHSLLKLKALPDEARLYCGHEYSLENYRFALELEPDNTDVLSRFDEIQAALRAGLPTVPSSIGQEKKTNPFLRASDPVLKEALGMADAPDEEVFAALRRRKDQF